MGDKLLISLYDYTGNWSRPYMENGWEVVRVDIQHGIDIMDFDYRQFHYWKYNRVGILIAQPCTDYALSGARHFKQKDIDGRTAKSQILVQRSKVIVDYALLKNESVFWVLENPMSRIHKLNPWLGEVKHKFNPCDYAGYDPVPTNSRYNKSTWLWGKFNIPEKKRLEPVDFYNPGWKNYGGSSLATKNARSVTPLGFSYAFYKANR